MEAENMEKQSELQLKNTEKRIRELGAHSPEINHQQPKGKGELRTSN